MSGAVGGGGGEGWGVSVLIGTKFQLRKVKIREMNDGKSYMTM